ncbi:N-acetyldiaminopimelate deacetylase [Gracilibacillus marinus]|uniref:N-acetyldiaminopimelate deacetylase n=1 Tax=Gracilibacillus marinus TaxID=630535 RepID=A0ABV8VS19_9BACI
MNYNQLIKIRRDLHQIPELGFREFKTQAYILQILEKIKTPNMVIEKWETGLFVYLKGKNPNKTLAYRADIDGLPIKEETNLPYHSKHEGCMHACGHDLHMTIAIGVINEIVRHPIDDNVLFIFQPAEEGPGGAKPMLQSEQFKKWNIDMIFALHIAPELPVGTVSSREGILFANTSELFIDFKGKGGHAAYPHLTKDMTVAASMFVAQIQQIISRKIDPLDSGVITIGKMTSGTVQNVIAEEAKLEGTIRTLNQETMRVIKAELERHIKGYELLYECKIRLDYGAMYHQVYNNGNVVSQFEKIMNSSNIIYKEANAAMTGEDFGYFLKEIDGFMFWLGVGSTYGLHHSKLNPNEEAIQIGVQAVVEMLKNYK